MTIEDKKKDGAFDDDFIKERVRRGIYKYSIREHGTWPNDTKYGEGQVFLRSVKYLPVGKRITALMVIWDDKVLVGLFSGGEQCVFVIESNQYANIQKRFLMKCGLFVKQKEKCNGCSFLRWLS